MTDQPPEQSYSRAVVVFFDSEAASVYVDAQMMHFKEMAHVKLVTDLRACGPLDDEFVRSVLRKPRGARVKVGQGALL